MCLGVFFVGVGGGGVGGVVVVVGGGSISNYFSPYFDVVWLMVRILFHPQVDLGMVYPSSIAPMHRFSPLLVFVPYSEDSDVPVTVGGTQKRGCVLCACAD